MRTATPGTLRDLLTARGLTYDATAVLAEVDTSTVSRIVSGTQRARPVTIVRLAQALGISAKRLKGMCDAAWETAHEGQDEAEWLPVA